MTDRETLRRLIAGDGETRIDSYEAADRVLAAGWRPSVTYRCPSCGTTDPWAFIRCQSSGCPDGRDRR